MKGARIAIDTVLILIFELIEALFFEPLVRLELVIRLGNLVPILSLS